MMVCVCARVPALLVHNQYLKDVYVCIYIIFRPNRDVRRPDSRAFELFFPFEAGVRFFLDFKKHFLNTGYITCLGMCKVYTEAVHSVAL